MHLNIFMTVEIVLFSAHPFGRLFRKSLKMP